MCDMFHTRLIPADSNVDITIMINERDWKRDRKRYEMEKRDKDDNDDKSIKY